MCSRATALPPLLPDGTPRKGQSLPKAIVDVNLIAAAALDHHGSACIEQAAHGIVIVIVIVNVISFSFDPPATPDRGAPCFPCRDAATRFCDSTPCAVHASVSLVADL